MHTDSVLMEKKMNEHKPRDGKFPRGVPAPLPTTSAEFALLRKKPAKFNLNDHLEPIHWKIWDTNPEYQKVHSTTYSETSVTGRLSFDQAACARIVREWAEENRDQFILDHTDAAIFSALNVIMRRYGRSLAERRAAAATVHIDVPQPGPSDKDEI